VDRKAVLHLELGCRVQKFLRGVRIDDDLRDPVAVANVDEGDTTMIALAVYPAVENH